MSAKQTQPLVGVVGPFHNGENFVSTWLTCFAKQTYSNFRLYVVDDGSVDRTARFLANGLARIQSNGKLISLPNNEGASKARNLGINTALSDGAEIILLLDSDCRVENDWIERHVQAHLQNPNVDVIGGAIRSASKTFIGRADGMASWFASVPGSKNRKVTKIHLSSTNMSLKRRVFDLVGFFNEAMATGEDVEFCRRVRTAGQTIFFQADIIMEHLDRDELVPARHHHYRWGLHSYPLSLLMGSGYYQMLTRIRYRWMVALLVPLFAILNTILIIAQYQRQSPSVWLHVPLIFYFKWWNALGVYHGYLDPTRALRKNQPLPAVSQLAIESKSARNTRAGEPSLPTMRSGPQKIA